MLVIGNHSDKERCFSYLRNKFSVSLYFLPYHSAPSLQFSDLFRKLYMKLYMITVLIFLWLSCKLSYLTGKGPRAFLCQFCILQKDYLPRKVPVRSADLFFKGIPGKRKIHVTINFTLIGKIKCK